MSRHAERREQLLDKVADHLLVAGIAGSSLRPLAEAVGLSDRMLLYYFKDKEDVIAGGLARVAERLTVRLEAATASTQMPLDQLRSRLADLLLDDAIWPYMQLWLEMASLSARGEEPFRTVGKSLGEHFLEWGSAQLASANEVDRARDAIHLLASLEGLVLLKSLGLDEALRGAY